MTKEEFVKTLDFLLSMGIIDYIQYNDLLIRTLPFLR